MIRIGKQGMLVRALLVCMGGILAMPLEAKLKATLNKEAKKAKPAKPPKPAIECPKLTRSEDLEVAMHVPRVLFFHSKTCGACDMIQEPFNKFMRKYNGKISCNVVDINDEEVADLVELFKVDSVPTIVTLHKLVGASDAETLEHDLIEMTGTAATKRTVMKRNESAPADHTIPLTPAEEEPLSYRDMPLSVTPEEIEPAA